MANNARAVEQTTRSAAFLLLALHLSMTPWGLCAPARRL